MNLSKSALVFPGQGSQSLGMLKDYFDNKTIFSKTFDEAKEILDVDFKSLIFSDKKDDLSRTEITQPLMLASNIAIWRELNLNPNSFGAMAGHSLGEYAALVAGGVIEFHDALKVVSIRAQLMQEAVPEGKGAIAAIIGLNYDAIESICLDITNSEQELVSPANINSPIQTVISGTSKGVDLAVERCKKEGAKRALPLAMSVPAHCKLMGDAALQFSDQLKKIKFQNPRIKIFQNYDAAYTMDVEKIATNLVHQIESPVRWVEIINNINALGVNTFIECGPAKVLSGLVKRIVNNVEIISLDDYSTFKEIFDKHK
jgi:[acyl-carrier-protein] S-malonyltransferase